MEKYKKLMQKQYISDFSSYVNDKLESSDGSYSVSDIQSISNISSRNMKH